MADAAVSMLVIIGLVAGRLFGWVWMDPLMGLVATFVILSWSWTLVRSAGAILLDACPDPALARKITVRLEQKGDRVSDLHLWRVGPGHLAAIISLVSDDPKAPGIYKKRLSGLSGLSHVTIEVERCPGVWELRAGHGPEGHRPNGHGPRPRRTKAATRKEKATLADIPDPLLFLARPDSILLTREMAGRENIAIDQKIQADKFKRWGDDLQEAKKRLEELEKAKAAAEAREAMFRNLAANDARCVAYDSIDNKAFASCGFFGAESLEVIDGQNHILLGGFSVPGANVLVWEPTRNRLYSPRESPTSPPTIKAR